MHLRIILAGRAWIILLLRVLFVQLRDVQVDGGVVLTLIARLVRCRGVGGRELSLLASRRRLVEVRLSGSARLQRHHLLLWMRAASGVLLLGRHEVLRHVLRGTHSEVYRVSRLLVDASHVALAGAVAGAERVLLRLVEVHVRSRRPALANQLMQPVHPAASVRATRSNRAGSDYITLSLVEVNCLRLVELDIAEFGGSCVSRCRHGALPLVVGRARSRPNAVRVVCSRVQLSLLIVTCILQLTRALAADHDCLVVTFTCGGRAGTLANRVRVLLHIRRNAVRHGTSD